MLGKWGLIMSDLKGIDWEQTQWLIKLTAIDKRAIARLNADLIPLEAFTTGLIDHLSDSDRATDDLKQILADIYLDQNKYHETLWKYDKVFNKVTGVKSPGPSITIRNILSYAGMYVEEFDAIIAVWLVLMGHRFSTLYAMLPLARLGDIEPIYTSILQAIAVDKPLLYEIGVRYFKSAKKKLSREQIHRIGLIQKKFLENCIEQFKIDDDFLSLQYAVRHLGVDLQMEFGSWLAQLDRAPPLDVYIPTEEKLKDALKDIGASVKTLQPNAKLFFS